MKTRPGRKAAWSLPGLCAATAVWALTAGLLASLAAVATAGLAESRRAASLCLAAASLEAAIQEAAGVLSPAPRRGGEELRLLRSDGGIDRIGVTGRALTRRTEGSGNVQVLSRDLDFAVFHVRHGRPAAVRYFLGCGERCLLSSSLCGGAP
jgi:hypothetical protein